jgi:CHAT domain-containing protein/Tfp pilus assembly protein PilF
MTQIFEMWKVTERAIALAMTILLIGCAQHGSAHSARTQTAKEQPATWTEEAARLDKEVEALFEGGKLQEAMPLAERSFALREQALGPRHPDVATSLDKLARLHQASGAYARAEPLYVRALDIREKVLGPTHPDVGSTLNDLASLLVEQGAYARAEPLLLRALDIAEKKSPGATNAHVATTLANLANLYQTQGAYARAEPLLLRALDILEQTVGPTHLDFAATLNNLAMNFLYQGAYKRSEPLLLRVLDIKEKVLGALHPGLATTLNNLAGVYLEQGMYARAEPLLVRSLAIEETALGAMHPGVATSLNNLAMLYQNQGRYARAEPLHVRALEIREKALGAMHSSVATSLTNLAMLYHEQGAYARAEPLWLRALDIEEKALGTMHPDVARTISSLAVNYRAQGAAAQAEPLYVRALEIKEKALGAMHPSVAASLNNLANFYASQGAYARAEPLYVRALEIQEKTLGAMHPSVAASLNNLALLFLDQGAYTRAEPLLMRALKIREQAQGELYPEIAQSLNNLAGLYQEQGLYPRATPLLARAAELQESNLRLELARLSESRKRELMSLLQGETERLVSLHAHAMPTSTQALELALTTVLRRKGRVLDSLADTQAIVRARAAPHLHDKLAELAEASTLLTNRLRSRFDPQTAERQKVEISALRTRIDKLEAELNAASVEFRAQSEPVTTAKIRAALPRGAALVELVRYRRFEGRNAPPRSKWQEARYLAYILPAQGPPRWVALGEAARIEAGVDAVLAAMRQRASADAAKAALRNLDALVLAPIRGRLAGVSHVIVSPDGKLNLVPFEALIDPQGRYALEQYLVSYVTSGRDLLRLGARQAPRSAATIVADPDYGPAGKPYVRVDGTHAEIYGRLAGTRAEADGIRGYFPDARTLAEGQATKAALTAIVGPSVLHIATHGFYTHAGVSAQAAPRPAPRERGMSIEGTTPPPPPPPLEDPLEALDRAGLALAGANVGPAGIVSARELAGLDLWGTQLVVLSACSTGVGAVPSGEGVYGLRRALVLAGARSQVVSLWNVNDSSAPELMRGFYEELARGTGRAEALRRAKLRIARQPRFAHPYYWAAFIAAGDWTPLAKGIMQPVDPAR